MTCQRLHFVLSCRERNIHFNTLHTPVSHSAHCAGYSWWVATLSGEKAAQSRPDLLNIVQSQHVTLRDLTMLNSPQFHVRMQDVIYVDVRNITIWVDIERQRDILIKAGQWLELDGVGADGLGKGLPMFPLNTGAIRQFAVMPTEKRDTSAIH